MMISMMMMMIDPRMTTAWRCSVVSPAGQHSADITSGSSEVVTHITCLTLSEDVMLIIMSQSYHHISNSSLTALSALTAQPLERL